MSGSCLEHEISLVSKKPSNLKARETSRVEKLLSIISSVSNRSIFVELDPLGNISTRKLVSEHVRTRDFALLQTKKQTPFSPNRKNQDTLLLSDSFLK